MINRKLEMWCIVFYSFEEEKKETELKKIEKDFS
jgi:alanyl-tRNA synthetase